MSKTYRKDKRQKDTIPSFPVSKGGHKNILKELEEEERQEVEDLPNDLR